jgi:GGDEF domain-containing protein
MKTKQTSIDDKVNGAIESLFGIDPDKMSRESKILLAQWLNKAALQNPELSKRVLSQGDIYDTLTDAYNRNFLDGRAKKAIERYAKSGKPVSVIYIDIDHFKKINDIYGHAAGDYVLRETVRAVEDNIRTKNIPGYNKREHDMLKLTAKSRYNKKPYRMGGEEFAVFLKSNLKDAGVCAERLRGTIESHYYHIPLDIRIKNNAIKRYVNVRISLGVAQFNPAEETIDDAMQRADKALYHSKEHGRNIASSLVYNTDTAKPIQKKMPEYYSMQPSARAA